MNTIQINNQAEWDALPSKFDEFTLLYIQNKDLIIIRTNPQNSRAELWENSRAELWENSRAVLWGNSRAVLWENSSAVLWGNSSAELRENNSAVLWGNSRAVLWGNSSAELRENNSAVLWGNSSAELWENSRAVLWGNSRAVLWGNSSAVLWENSSAVLWGNSSAVLWENSLSQIYSTNAQVKAHHNAVIIFEGIVSPKNLKVPSSVQVIHRNPYLHNIETFIETYALKPIEGEITLFKYVEDDFTDHWSGRIKYDLGKEITCPDWDSNPERQCGGGFHLSATKEDARKYNKTGKLIACEVALKDIVVYPHDITKVRCRKVRVLHEIKAGPPTEAGEKG